MQIRIADFKLGDIVEVQQNYDPATLDLEFVDLKYLTPLTLTGTVERNLNLITFRGNLSSEIEHLCGRCLKTIQDTVKIPFEFYYETHGDEEVIETLEDIRETVLVDHPMIFLCSDTCKGLCTQCGVNLNETECRCAEKPKVKESEPFSNLKKMLKKKHEEES